MSSAPGSRSILLLVVLLAAVGLAVGVVWRQLDVPSVPDDPSQSVRQDASAQTAAGGEAAGGDVQGSGGEDPSRQPIVGEHKDLSGPMGDPAYLAALAGMTGRIVGPSGKPIAGLQVEVSIVPRGERSGTRSSRRTRADGRFDIRGLGSTDRGSLKITVSGKGWTGRFRGDDQGWRWLRLTPGRTLACGDLRVFRSGRVAGVVLGADGAPLAEARVELVEGQAREVPGALLSSRNGATWPGRTGDPVELSGALPTGLGRVHVVQSGADGSFRFAGVAPGPCLLIAQVPGVTLPVHTPAVVVASEIVELEPLRPRPDTATLRVDVVDHRGKPVPGAELLVLSADSQARWRGVSVAAKKVGSTFSLSGLPKAPYVLGARRRNGAWVLLRRPAPTAEIATGQVRLGQRMKLNVRVVDEAGHPADNISWAVSNHRQTTLSGEKNVALDLVPTRVGHGRFRFEGMDARSYRIEASQPGAWGVRFVDPSSVETIEIRLGAIREVRFAVVDEAGHPVQHAKIQAAGQAVGFTGADGTVTARLVKRPHLWRLSVQHPEFEPHRDEIQAPEDQVSIALKRRSEVSGRLRLEPGPGAPAGWHLLYNNESDTEDSTSVDAAGQFKLRPKADGTISIERLYTSEFESVPFRVTSHPGKEIRLEPKGPNLIELVADWRPPAKVGALRGTLRVNDKPAVGYSVWNDDLYSRVGVDARGAFHLDRLAGRRFELRFSRQKPEPSITLWEGRLLSAKAASQPWNLRFETGAVEGRVVDATGRPAAKARVIVRSPHDCGLGPGVTWVAVDTGVDGSFSLPQVVAGRYRCEAYSEGRGGFTANVAVVAGSTSRGVVLKLGRLASVAGSFDLSGLGVRYDEKHVYGNDCELDVMLRGPLGDKWCSVKEQKFTAKGVLPGAYRLVLRFSKGTDRLEIVHPEPIVVGGEKRMGVVRRFGAEVREGLVGEAGARGVSLTKLLESKGLQVN